MKKENVKNIVKKAANKAVMAGLMVSNAIMMMPFSDSYATNLLNNTGGVGKSDEITVNTGLSANTLVSRVVGLIAGVISIAGVLTAVGGFQQYMEAKEDDNTAGQSKAQRKIVIGVIEIAAWPIVQFLFK